jgi:hypothetical protein
MEVNRKENTSMFLTPPPEALQRFSATMFIEKKLKS